MRRVFDSIARLLRKDAAPDMQRLAERYERELQRLDATLQAEKMKAEAQARMTYTTWKIEKEREKTYALAYGVQVPRTTLQHEQDRFFTAFEARLAEEQERFAKETQRIEAEERRRIEYRDHQAQSEEDAERERQERAEREALRAEAERQYANRVLQILESDLK